VLSTLPKTLGETFDRAAKRIVKRGSAQAASNIFQWVAATKRPLIIDELREALSYQPGVSYSIPGKRPNGLERLTAWCENLVQLDEELQIVQFAHHSVLQHFLEQSTDSSLQSFHIDLKEADHFVGEICVTYLNSNDFKTDLVKAPASLPIQLPNHVIQEVLGDKGFKSHMKDMAQRVTVKIYHRSTNKSSRRMVIANDSEDLKATLQLGHPFLDYASDYWILHTRYFEQHKSRTWNIWKQMIHGTHSVAKTPWLPADLDNMTSIAFDWIDQYDHVALFQQIVSNSSLGSKERIALIRRYAQLGRLDFMNILIILTEDKGELPYGLRDAAEAGHLEVVQKLLDSKANINAADFKGRTALQAAAGGGHLEVVQKLLDSKADINAVYGYGRTALQAAAGGGHLEVVQKLLDLKADINAVAASRYGRTALQAAAGGGHLEVVQKLLDSKADVNTAAANYNGRTALQAAAGGGHLEVVQKLLDSKADVNAAAAEDTGRTALQAAAEGGHLEVVQKLLDSKADVNAAASINGRTALQVAAIGGHLEIIKVLKSFGK
jgi:ankyrin repeat protein